MSPKGDDDFTTTPRGPPTVCLSFVAGRRRRRRSCGRAHPPSPSPAGPFFDVSFPLFCFSLAVVGPLASGRSAVGHLRGIHALTRWWTGVHVAGVVVIDFSRSALIFAVSCIIFPMAPRTTHSLPSHNRARNDDRTQFLGFGQSCYCACWGCWCQRTWCAAAPSAGSCAAPCAFWSPKISIKHAFLCGLDDVCRYGRVSVVNSDIILLCILEGFVEMDNSAALRTLGPFGMNAMIPQSERERPTSRPPAEMAGAGPRARADVDRGVCAPWTAESRSGRSGLATIRRSRRCTPTTYAYGWLPLQRSPSQRHKTPFSPCLCRHWT